jgi:hypothetical protein
MHIPLRSWNLLLLVAVAPCLSACAGTYGLAFEVARVDNLSVPECRDQIRQAIESALLQQKEKPEVAHNLADLAADRLAREPLVVGGYESRFVVDQRILTTKFNVGSPSGLEYDFETHLSRTTKVCNLHTYGSTDVPLPSCTCVVAQY